MIVVGIDPHMKTHTAVALDGATGRAIAETTVACDSEGHDELVAWARALSDDHYFAIEDCRHVSGRLERHLIPRGETVVRVPPKMMAGARHSARAYGKSDPIDAAAVARAALREPGLPLRRFRGPKATCAYWQTTATTSSTSANASRHACDGTATTWRLASRCRLGCSTATCGSIDLKGS